MVSSPLNFMQPNRATKRKLVLHTYHVPNNNERTTRAISQQHAKSQQNCAKQTQHMHTLIAQHAPPLPFIPSHHHPYQLLSSSFPHHLTISFPHHFPSRPSPPPAPTYSLTSASSKLPDTSCCCAETTTGTCVITAITSGSGMSGMLSSLMSLSLLVMAERHDLGRLLLSRRRWSCLGVGEVGEGCMGWVFCGSNTHTQRAH